MTPLYTLEHFDAIPFFQKTFYSPFRGYGRGLGIDLGVAVFGRYANLRRLPRLRP